jgi:hypothetical protein
MKTRDEVQTMLEEVLGSKNVYFQAPPNTGMKYPCIVYRFDHFDMKKADNTPYMLTGRWEIHHMYKSIKNDMKEKMLFIAPYVTFDRRIVTDGVYNDYYTIFQ